jgi:hypothetical protein
VTQKGLRCAAFAIVVLGAVGLALGNGIVGSTFGLFNGETQNAASSFAGGWVDAPSALTATASGYDVGLAWTPGTHGPVTGQTLNGVDNNTNSNCTGAAYALIATMPLATTATYTDSSRGSAANNGHWFCYQLVSTSATVWTAPTPQVLQLGLVTSAITITNHGTNNSIDATDTIMLTFNQRTNKAASGTTKVCVLTSGKIILGDTTGGAACATGDGFNIGTITGVTIGTNRVYQNSTFTTTTAAAPWTMTITLVGAGASTYSGTATFTPSSSILSNATTHQATMCTTASAICQPTTTTHF